MKPGKKTTINDLVELMKQARDRGPMSDEERREQAASFTFGNLALTKEWREKSVIELAELRKLCRKMAGCK